MSTYTESLTARARLVHGRLAKWLQNDVAFISESESNAMFFVPLNGYNAGISYNKETETYTVFQVTDELEPMAMVRVTVEAFMVGEMFTRKRLINALTAIA